MCLYESNDRRLFRTLLSERIVYKSTRMRKLFVFLILFLLVDYFALCWGDSSTQETDSAGIDNADSNDDSQGDDAASSQDGDGTSNQGDDGTGNQGDDGASSQDDDGTGSQDDDGTGNQGDDGTGNHGGPVLPNDDGSAFNEDQQNGEAYEQQEKEKEEEEERKAKETTGNHAHELEILEAEAHYEKWRQEYFDTGVMPERTDEVVSFMDENGITVDSVIQQYNQHLNSGRKRRSYLDSGAGIWTKCIIPYIYESIPESAHSSMDKVHAYYEKYTGFRFVKYDVNTTRDQYGLDHDNYIRYVKGSGCWSYVGNLGGKGQKLSPCGGGGVAIHELGHALGMMHEQKSPQSFPYITNNYANIQPSYRSQYYRNDIDALYDKTGFYDISSRMHYGRSGFNINYARTMAANDPEYTYLIGASNDYYMFKELQEFHKCYDEFSSCDVKPTCYNGGYVSVIDGQCACRCPPELDSEQNCTKKLGTDVGLQSLTWPEGTFTMLKTNVVECPDGFENGTMVHWPVSNIWHSSPYRHSPAPQSYELGHDVCTKTDPAAGTATWQPGDYCVLRYGGECPDGFVLGYQDTYGPVKRNDTNVGTLPDGNHDYPFEYIYCCRNDGDRNEPIQLPTIQPFILYMRNYHGCQVVEGMLSSTEYFNFKSDTSISLNETGLLPYMYRYDNHRRNIYFCYYTPKTQDCGMLKVLDETEPMFIFTSPNYPENYDNAMECFWHITSPEGTRMQLDFTDFQVSAADSSSCTDHVEIGFVRPSVKGFSVCGHGYKKTIWSWVNFLSLKLVTKLGSTYRGFNATVTVFRDADLCYSDDAKSYTGGVNYVKSFEPCIPWHKATKCLFNKFDPKVVDMRLTGNQCRNVGPGTQPWCYTNSETCQRQNCDACMSGSCYDVFLDCEAQIANDNDFCLKNELGEAHRGCMDSCGLCQQRIIQTGETTCVSPSIVNEIHPDTNQTSFKVGDHVTYNCPTSDEYQTSTCTSEGTWTDVNFVCESCPPGFAVFQQRCFAWLGWEVKVDYATAMDKCNELGAALVKVDSQDVSDFVRSIVEYSKEDNTNIWLGGTVDGNRVWSWLDGTLFSDGWTNWGSGQPNDWGKNQDCPQMESDADWDDTVCTREKSVVCEYMFDKSRACDDMIPDCVDILKDNPDMCVQRPVFALHNCKTTCGVGDCQSSVECVDDSTPEYKTNRVAGLDKVSPGQYIKYECNQGYIKKSGDDARVCMTSGNLTGSSLVCEETGVCGDFLNDCATTLAENLKMCEDNPEYADRYCRSTCAVASCGSTTSCMDDGNPSNYTTRQHGSDVLNVGQYVEYSCDSGTLKASGDHTRVCLSSGSLSGSPLTCAPKVQCEDKVTTCESMLSVTPEMCERHASFAWRNCMKTCGFAECKVPTTCTDDTEQSVAIFRLRGSDQVDVGDFIEYRCGEGYMKTGGDTKRACLPDGTLSGQPIACLSVGDCESDDPGCDHMLAENPKMCEEDGDFAYHTCHTTCGFGATMTCEDDTQQATTVRLMKGSSPLNPGQYLEYSCEAGYLRDSGDFVRVCGPSGNLTGSALTCTIPSTVTSCEDLHVDCDHMLDMNPAMCGMFPKYAAQFCRKSCAVSGCETDGTCDAAPSTNSNVSKVSGADQLNVGQYAEYECTTNLLKHSGTFKRACLPTGQLTGVEEPSCLVNHKDSSPSIVCKDQLDRCQDDLEDTPDMCARYPEYSWHNCRKTCGVGECLPRTTCEDDTSLGYRGMRMTGSDAIKVGEYIEYMCNEGYFKGSGAEMRACLPSGNLTGSPLTCLHRDVTTNVDLFTDKEIYRRPEGGTTRRFVLANVTDMRFTVSGNVTSWTFYSNYPKEIAFSVWRLYDNETHAMKPRLIGQNIITDNPNGRGYIYRVPEAEQIYAEVGDVIGIYQYGSELSYTRCSTTYQPEHSPWLQTDSKKNKASFFAVGEDHLFKTSSRDCRIYSIRASVNPSVCTGDD